LLGGNGLRPTGVNYTNPLPPHQPGSPHCLRTCPHGAEAFIFFGLNPSLARGFFGGFGGDPNGDHAASFSLVRNPTLPAALVWQAACAGSCPPTPNGNRLVRGRRRPPVEPTNRGLCFMPSLWSSLDQPWSPPRGSGAQVQCENIQSPWPAP